MFANTLTRRFFFNFAFIFVFLSIYIILFYPVFVSNEVIINFAMHPFNIWKNLKLFYILVSSTSSLITINLIYSSIFTKKTLKKNTKNKISSDLSLYIANDNLGFPIILPEASLYQNILITGTIGSGKTSSAMYPFTRQLIKYKYFDETLKLGMLILDVKGNYYSQVQKYTNYYRRQKDLIVIQLRWKY